MNNANNLILTVLQAYPRSAFSRIGNIYADNHSPFYQAYHELLEAMTQDPGVSEQLAPLGLLHGTLAAIRSYRSHSRVQYIVDKQLIEQAEGTVDPRLFSALFDVLALSYGLEPALKLFERIEPRLSHYSEDAEEGAVLNPVVLSLASSGPSQVFFGNVYPRSREKELVELYGAIQKGIQYALSKARPRDLIVMYPLMQAAVDEDSERLRALVKTIKRVQQVLSSLGAPAYTAERLRDCIDNNTLDDAISRSLTTVTKDLPIEHQALEYHRAKSSQIYPVLKCVDDSRQHHITWVQQAQTSKLTGQVDAYVKQNSVGQNTLAKLLIYNQVGEGGSGEPKRLYRSSLRKALEKFYTKEVESPAHVLEETLAVMNRPLERAFSSNVLAQVAAGQVGRDSNDNDLPSVITGERPTVGMVSEIRAHAEAATVPMWANYYAMNIDPHVIMLPHEKVLVEEIPPRLAADGVLCPSLEAFVNTTSQLLERWLAETSTSITVEGDTLVLDLEQLQHRLSNLATFANRCYFTSRILESIGDVKHMEAAGFMVGDGENSAATRINDALKAQRILIDRQLVHELNDNAWQQFLQNPSGDAPVIVRQGNTGEAVSVIGQKRIVMLNAKLRRQLIVAHKDACEKCSERQLARGLHEDMQRDMPVMPLAPRFKSPST